MRARIAHRHSSAATQNARLGDDTASGAGGGPQRPPYAGGDGGGAEARPRGQTARNGPNWAGPGAGSELGQASWRKGGQWRDRRRRPILLRQLHHLRHRFRRITPACA